MTVWRVGRKLGVTLYRDEVFVGHVCSATVAAEIVETMNRVGRLLDEVRAEPPSRCGYPDCCPQPEPRTDWSRVDPYDTTKGFQDPQ